MAYKEIVPVVCMQEASPEICELEFQASSSRERVLIFAKTLKMHSVRLFGVETVQPNSFKFGKMPSHSKTADKLSAISISHIVS